MNCIINFILFSKSLYSVFVGKQAAVYLVLLNAWAGNVFRGEFNLEMFPIHIRN